MSKVCVSGRSRGEDQLDCMLKGLAGFFRAHATACVFAHLSMPTKAAAPLIQAVVDRHARVAVVEVEYVTQDAAVESTMLECTGGLSQDFVSLLQSRRPRDGAISSHLQMNRHIWLAHILARRASPSLQYVTRTRVDNAHHVPAIDWWPKVEAAASRGAIVTGSAAAWLCAGRRSGVPEAARCMTDDQFAAGPVDLMDGYASLFPDFATGVHLMPWYRPDFRGHTNERSLAAHLHYRNVPFEEQYIGHAIHSFGPGCDGTRAPRSQSQTNISRRGG